MKIPKKCPKCGGIAVFTETGIDITRFFKAGKYGSTIRRPTPRRVYCDGCFYEFTGEEET